MEIRKMLFIEKELSEQKQKLILKVETLQTEIKALETVLTVIAKMNPDSTLEMISNDFVDMSFEEAILTLFKTFPTKEWEPKELGYALLQRGFITKTATIKKFNDVVRTRLPYLRTKNIVSYRQVIKKTQMHHVYFHKNLKEGDNDGK